MLLKNIDIFIDNKKLDLQNCLSNIWKTILNCKIASQDCKKNIAENLLLFKQVPFLNYLLQINQRKFKNLYSTICKVNFPTINVTIKNLPQSVIAILSTIQI